MTANEQQSAAWNGAESRHYVEQADRYDRQLEPFAAALLERARLHPDEAVLDVGCGCGVTTLAAARVARHALGIDISGPLLEVASARAQAEALDHAEFLRADAQTHAFDPTFDVIISQFGLMFFDDPVGAFSNLGGALVPGGRLTFVSWQALEANDWLTVVGDAIAEHTELPTLGGLAGGPGMFALKDPDEIADLLDAAGFAGVEIEPVTPTINIGGGGNFDECVAFLLDMGIVRGLLSRVDDATRPDAVAAVRRALTARHEEGVGTTLGAAGWLVSAAR